MHTLSLLHISPHLIFICNSSDYENFRSSPEFLTLPCSSEAPQLLIVLRGVTELGFRFSWSPQKRFKFSQSNYSDFSKSLIHPNKHLLSTYCFPETVLCTEGTKIKDAVLHPKTTERINRTESGVPEKTSWRRLNFQGWLEVRKEREKAC